MISLSDDFDCIGGEGWYNVSSTCLDAIFSYVAQRIF